MSFKCGSVSKYKNPLVVEEKEEWSTGLELDILLETSTRERGLNEDSHKVQDQNSMEEPSRAQEIDGVCGVGGRGGGVGGCWWHWLVVFVVALRDSEELPEQSQPEKIKAKERYENNIERGRQGFVDGDEENKSEKDEELEREKEDDRQQDDNGSPMGRELISTSNIMKIENIDKLFKRSYFGCFLEQPMDPPDRFQMRIVYGLLKHRIKYVGDDKATTIRRAVRQGHPNVKALYDQLIEADSNASSGGVVGVGGRHADAFKTRDDKHVDAQEKINMFENTSFTGPSYPSSPSCSRCKCKECKDSQDKLFEKVEAISKVVEKFK
ncbi:hypothetical protein FXO38_35417 [Capsicum annuum]|nr:hypothetical protein FXO38_35417 [Capsicum annuum]